MPFLGLVCFLLAALDAASALRGPPLTADSRSPAIPLWLGATSRTLHSDDRFGA
jgi:hypothetical protein